MEPIRKTIVRKRQDRKAQLFFVTDRYAFLALLALPIIVGLELYYQNRYGNPGTTYIGGPCTYIYGILWLVAFYEHRQARKRLNQLTDGQGGQIEEGVCFAADSFSVTISGYASCEYPWDSLSAFRNRKRNLSFTVAGIEFVVPKKYFTSEEVSQITALLWARMRPSGGTT